ncbi:hypothetical protein T11_1607 [Trichinella zimbabwensis]|uniref:Uncharacterized protein n=1 Tax=Trichinella zimbabwensis TaxID=268475 RepID=A0A0V1H6D5_9BILA|nr:hypothetical protein T11_1607 [Trichinella zimbabwensis]
MKLGQDYASIKKEQAKNPVQFQHLSASLIESSVTISTSAQIRRPSFHSHSYSYSYSRSTLKGLMQKEKTRWHPADLDDPVNFNGNLSPIDNDGWMNE